ncbi:MAG: phosphoribosylamine--glycine ligase [Roseburia sp.]|nr:phosphoribosylamine--glycine ligase [Roseburia sp.]
MSLTEKRKETGSVARRVQFKDAQPHGDDILVVGGGGREHAIVSKLRESAKVGEIYGAPGNAGMDVVETGIGATEIEKIVQYVDTHKNIKFTVVAPDDPLALGLVDELEKRGHRAFGPKKAAARLEWSKAYAKDVMRRYGIPTAAYGAFDSAAAATEFIRGGKFPVVVKADGLALGKGVLICEDEKSAMAAVEEIMTDKKFGAAGNKIIVEEFLKGYEVSLLAFSDGEHYSLMPTSCDHKRALDGDKGLNTGGMGAYSPCPRFTEEILQKTVKTVVEPTLSAMRKEGAPFKGVLYFGLMVDGDDVRVLEYNARFGDPETQSVLPLLKTDLYDIFNATVDGTLDRLDIEWSDKKSVNVVLASGGYPLSYKKGCPITGLGDVSRDVNVFYAGVKREGDGLITSGGRVLCVQTVADDFKTALDRVYANIRKIKFDGCFYRKDIGKAALDNGATCDKR